LRIPFLTVSLLSLFLLLALITLAVFVIVAATDVEELVHLLSYHAMDLLGRHPHILAEVQQRLHLGSRRRNDDARLLDPATDSVGAFDALLRVVVAVG